MKAIAPTPVGIQNLREFSRAFCVSVATLKVSWAGFFQEVTLILHLQLRNVPIIWSSVQTKPVKMAPAMANAHAASRPSEVAR